MAAPTAPTSSPNVDDVTRTSCEPPRARAAPRARMTRNLWEFMEFYTGYERQRILSPMLGDLPTNLRTITERHYNPRAELFRQMLPTSTSRPPLPVGSVAWDTLQRSRSSVIIGSQTPREAVATNHLSVAPKMALFEGYQMPATYGQNGVIPG